MLLLQKSEIEIGQILVSCHVSIRIVVHSKINKFYLDLASESEILTVVAKDLDLPTLILLTSKSFSIFLH